MPKMSLILFSPFNAANGGVHPRGLGSAKTAAPMPNKPLKLEGESAKSAAAAILSAGVFRRGQLPLTPS
jgi:hypothetical protein